MATPPIFTAGQILTAAQMNQVGLFLVKSVTIGAGVSSIPVADAYPTDYDNFKIIVNVETSNASQSIMYRHVDSGGTDNSVNYARSGYFMSNTTLNGVFDSQTEWEIGRTVSGQASSASFDVMYPNAARWANSATQTRSTVGVNFAQQHQVGAAFPSFRLFISGGGTVSGGSVRVYGYRK
jgi:hypothetical protein